MNSRGDRPLVIVLAVAAFLAPLLTAGATALFFLSRQQDDRIGSLRHELTTMRQANERLFGQLADETAARNQISAKLTALELRASAVDRQLEETNAKLAASQRALRWQKRAAQKARRQARAARPTGVAWSSGPIRRGLLASFFLPRVRRPPPASAATPARPAAPAPPALASLPAPPQPAVVSAPHSLDDTARPPGRSGGRGR